MYAITKDNIKYVSDVPIEGNHIIFTKDRMSLKKDISLEITEKDKEYLSVTYIPDSDQIIIKTPYEVYEGPLKLLSFGDALETRK